MGAAISEVDGALSIPPGQSLKGIEVDLNDCIDAITILSVIACYAEGTTRITNASIAREKECNRIACIVQELKKMGAQIEETPDGLEVVGGPLEGAEVASSHDHRMAMSLAIAALGARGETLVHDTRCVCKTYPTFAEDMKGIGASMEVMA